MAEAVIRSEAGDKQRTLQIVAPGPARWRRTRSRAWTFFAAAAAGVPLTILLGLASSLLPDTPTGAPLSKWVVGGLLALCTALCALGVLTSLFALIQLARARERGALAAAGGLFAQAVGGTLAAWCGAVATFMATLGFARGRQLRRFGQIQLPPVTDGDAWARLPLQLNADASVRAALAAQWRENGRTEHASIAAFARLTLDLVALGAPPELIKGSQQDALDELRHTQLCFSLARALDGKAVSPAAFPAALSNQLSLPRTAGLARLAVDSLVDGALHEGVSARVIAKLVRRCEDAATREVLREIAGDEGRHAAHGWDVVEWCIAEGGPLVQHALRGAVRAIPQDLHATLPEASRGGAWERFGIHGADLEQQEYARAREDVVRHVQRLTAAPHRAA